MSVKAHGRKCQFSDLFLIQELSDPAPPNYVIKDKKVLFGGIAGMSCQDKCFLWSLCRTKRTLPYYAIKFSKDGHYLAAGGQDRIVRVWKLIVQSVLERLIQLREHCQGYFMKHRSDGFMAMKGTCWIWRGAGHASNYLTLCLNGQDGQDVASQ